MPARKTDWKKELDRMEGKQTELLKAGNRTSEGNEGRFKPNTSRDDLLHMLEANRKMYQTLRKSKKPQDTRPIHDRLKGLFGGG